MDSAVIEVRKSKFGKGLFAKNDINATTTLCKASGEELNFEETLELHEREAIHFK